MKQKKLVSVIAGILAFLLIFTLIISILPAQIFAADGLESTISSLESDIEDLEAQADQIQEKKDALAAQQAENEADTQNVVDRKRNIDQEIQLLHEEINNTNAQIQAYNQLISEKQKELDAAQTRQKDLNARYRVRIRAMEKGGTTSYWEVLLQAKSFTDLLDRINTVKEIAAADEAMLAELNEVAQNIADAQNALAEEKQSLENQKQELAASQTELDAKSAEADEILSELIVLSKEMAAQFEEYEDQENALVDQIAAKEEELNKANKELEEQRRKEQEASQGGSSGGSSSGGSEGGSAPSGGTWAQPLPYYTVTSSYGWRIHPITGKETFHNGVDLAASYGTPVYATRSGTVTAAEYDYYLGNYVTINHGDGFSSLYGHMRNYVVSAGEYVEQGQVIGYEGDTGVYCTGPHLHFTIYYNGSTVNPMNYI